LVNAATTAAVTGSATAQSVTLTNVKGIYLGRVVTVDTGTTSETVRVISCTTTTTVANGCTSGGSNSMNWVFKLDHAYTGGVGVPVTGGLNPLPEGVPFDLSDTA